MKKGFTLIELLVVVLIIGILAAVALPQYTKAVEKARATELLNMVNAGEKAIQMAFLSGIVPAATSEECLLGKDIMTDIALSGGEWETTESNDFVYFTKNFEFSISCCPEICYIEADRNSSEHNWGIRNRYYPSGIIKRACETQGTDTGRTICRSLESLGYEYREER